jgi:hydroxymethylglutaryl-CoA synthase
LSGVIAYGTYLPYHRLDRRRIKEVLGAGGGKGTRAVASYDEDTTSMGVEAARLALAGVADRGIVAQLLFASANPAYADKTNATAIHAALSLPSETLALDLTGAVRSGVGALLLAGQSPVPTLAVLSDVRTGLPGGADERDGGDGAAAFLFGNDGDQPVLAEVVATASATEEFLERWRTPGAGASRVWEDRFGEEAYVPLVEAAFADVLKQASIAAGQIDHLVVSGLHARAVKRAVKITGVNADAVADDLVAQVGNSGTAQAGILLADVLDRAEADQYVLVLVLADGVTALLLRTTPALIAGRPSRSTRSQVGAGNSALDYATFLSWRGLLDREPPRRPDPESPASPPALRRLDWKFGFIAARCTQCGTRSLPPDRVCRSCHSIDQTVPEPLADVAGTTATYTVDHLAFTPNPPVLVVVVDYDGGGRLRCQLTDAAPDEVAIGLRVEMTFRRLITTDGVHNYFWKARPVRDEAGVPVVADRRP